MIVVETGIVNAGILDGDGTIFDGNMTIDLFRVLAEKRVILKEMGDKVFACYAKYKSAKIAEKPAIVGEIYKLFGESLKGKSEDDIRMISEETFSKLSDRLFSFSEPLVVSLKERGFKVILVSGSMVEMVRVLGARLGIDEQNIIAGKLKLRNGIYTGGVVSYIGSSSQKIRAINRYSKKNNIYIDWRRSFGIGNNERDWGILSRVGIKFFFEPNGALKARAEKGNFIIVDRNNVIDTWNRLKITYAVNL